MYYTRQCVMETHQQLFYKQFTLEIVFLNDLQSLFLG